MKLVDTLPLDTAPPGTTAAQISQRSVLTVLLALLPIVVLLSGMAMTPYLVLLALLMIAAQAGRVDLGALFQEGRTTFLVMALIIGLPILSIAWSITPGISAEWALKTAAIMVIGAIALLLSRRLPGLAPSSVTAFAASILLCAVLVMLEQLPHGGVLALGYDLSHANFDKYIHKNVNRGLCALAVFVWPASLALERAGRKVAAQVMPWVVALPIAVMHSLSAKMAMIFGLAVFYGLRQFPKTMKRVPVLLVPMFFVLWPVAFNTFYDSFFNAPAVYKRMPDSSQARVDIWHFVSGKIMERPVLGWGLESSRSIPGGTTEYMPGRTYLPLHPHNNALQTLLEEGVVGFALTLTALTLVLLAWRKRWSRDPAESAAGGALIAAYLVIGFSAFGLWQTWWIASAWIAAVIFEIARRGNLGVSQR